MKTLAKRRRLLKLTGWQIKSRVNPKIKPKAHVLWNYCEQTATIEFREEFDEELQSNLFWHELGHLVLMDIRELLSSLLTKEEFAHYRELQERAVNQFAGALDATKPS